MPIYCADPYSPRQRSTNEQTNDLLRRYFPKGTDFCRVTTERADEVFVRAKRGPKSGEQDASIIPIALTK